jgi:hypothetical protein
MYEFCNVIGFDGMPAVVGIMIAFGGLHGKHPDAAGGTEDDPTPGVIGTGL